MHFKIKPIPFLHATVIEPNGHRIEIQIRTEEMHKIAEYGVAAHWSYKDKHSKEKSNVDFTWLRQILDEQQQSPDHFIENIKINLYDDEVLYLHQKETLSIYQKRQQFMMQHSKFTRILGSISNQVLLMDE